jgi:hypothetical protein
MIRKRSEISLIRGMNDNHPMIEEPDESKGSRPVVRPAKAGAFSGNQSHPGKNQKPGSLDGREERNQ